MAFWKTIIVALGIVFHIIIQYSNKWKPYPRNDKLYEVGGYVICLGEGDLEILEDEDHVVMRYKRSAEVCKYKKGEFGECDLMTMVGSYHPSLSSSVEYKYFQLMTREDKLKSKNSSPQCEKLRTITKNCKDMAQAQQQTQQSKSTKYFS